MVAVIESAELERAPVILGCGCALVDQGWMDSIGIASLVGLARRLAERSAVPAAVLLNEARSLEQAMKGVDAGCNAVMLDTSRRPYGTAVEMVLDLVSRAHAVGVAVEGEVGCLPDADMRGRPRSPGELTDPAEAVAFVRATGVDCLAVAVGNVHLLLNGSAEIDLDRLAAIHEATPVPLVIHGGTGFPEPLVPAAIARGVAKFNVGTVLKADFLAGARRGMEGMERGADVQSGVGSHGAGDYLLQGQIRVHEKVRELMRLYGSSGKAVA
jgi:fructose-bisphosphate aldolase class II